MPRTFEITSPDNPRLKVWRELLTGRGISKHGLALVAGDKQIREILARHPARCRAVLASPRHVVSTGAADLERYLLAPALFEELDVFGTGQPLLLITAGELPVWEPSQVWPKGCTLFVAFQNPDNVGAVIRSAAAFGVARIVLLQEAANPFLPKSFRAAGPGLLDVALLRGPSITTLAAGKVPLIGLDAAGEHTVSHPWPETFGLIAGIEGPGLPATLRGSSCRRIDMEPGQESLNGATAVAVALFAWRQQRT